MKTQIQRILVLVILSGVFLLPVIVYAETQTINLIQFNQNSVPEEFYKPKPVVKQPLPIKEIVDMKKGGVDEEVIQDAIEKRKVIGGSNAKALVSLKKAGFGKDVLKAVSRYALPKNRSIDLEFTLEFIKPSLRADPRYLYIIFKDGNYDRIFHADLEEVLKGKWKYDDTKDLQEPVLSKSVRTIRFFGNVTLKNYGKIKAKVVLSKKPNIQKIKELSKKEIKLASIQEFDYPAYSLLNDCRLKIEFTHGVALDYKWKINSTNMSCEFD